MLVLRFYVGLFHNWSFAELMYFINGVVVTTEQDIRTNSSQFSAEALKQFPDIAVSAGEAAKSKSFHDASPCDTFINTEQLEISSQQVTFVWTSILFG